MFSPPYLWRFLDLEIRNILKLEELEIIMKKQSILKIKRFL